MTKRYKLLVADDERLIREFLGRILIGAGYVVTFAEDGKSAVEKAATEKPDLVLMDGLMPKLHGFLACKAIKELDKPPKVVMFTGVYTKPTYRSEARNYYLADGILTKPIDKGALLAEIAKHLPGGASREGEPSGFNIVWPQDLGQGSASSLSRPSIEMAAHNQSRR